jgi:hypothetical protein
MRSKILPAIALALVAVAGCSDLPLGEGGSGGDFAVTVGCGTQPLYTWPSGLAFSIDVVRASYETVSVWRVANPNTSNIGSPLRHGTVPSGAVELVGTEKTLTAGVQYKVTITLADQRQAFQTFRP